MALVKKDVKYLNKDFSQFREKLVNFAKTYFPDTYTDFNETSPGMMFIEMTAYVGDVLSLYIDNQLRESMLLHAEEHPQDFRHDVLHPEYQDEEWNSVELSI